jgi:hypothetical protein
MNRPRVIFLFAIIMVLSVSSCEFISCGCSSPPRYGVYVTLVDDEGVFYIDSGYQYQYFQVLIERDGEWEMAKSHLQYDGTPGIKKDEDGVLWLFFPTDYTRSESVNLIKWPEGYVDTVRVIMDLDKTQSTDLWYNNQEVELNTHFSNYAVVLER